MTDFRALCAELMEALDGSNGFLNSDGEWVTPEPYFTLIQRTRAALAQPEPQGPSDEEILALSQWHEVSYTLSDGRVVYPLQEGADMKDAVLSFTRAVLARWGRPAIEPVAVAERLPGPEDLDHEGTCWMFHPANFHYCLCRPDPSVHTHWLPHYALPVPTPNNNTKQED
jgi:hypothetical protein